MNVAWDSKELHTCEQSRTPAWHPHGSHTGIWKRSLSEGIYKRAL